MYETFSIQFYYRDVQHNQKSDQYIKHKYLNSENGQFQQKCLCYTYTKYTEGVNYPKGRSLKAVTSHVHYYMPPYKCQRVINSYAKLWGPGTP